VKPVHGASGRIDVQGTMQAITGVVEGWVPQASGAAAVGAPEVAAKSCFRC
jgi:hypothetical protein